MKFCFSVGQQGQEFDYLHEIFVVGKDVSTQHLVTRLCQPFLDSLWTSCLVGMCARRWKNSLAGMCISIFSVVPPQTVFVQMIFTWSAGYPLCIQRILWLNHYRAVLIFHRKRIKKKETTRFWIGEGKNWKSEVLASPKSRPPVARTTPLRFCWSRASIRRAGRRTSKRWKRERIIENIE